MAPRRSTEPITRISVFLYQRQIEALNEVHARTQLPLSVLIRQGVDLVLDRYGATGPKDRGKGPAQGSRRPGAGRAGRPRRRP